MEKIEKKQLQQMKASERFALLAEIMKVMEKAGFNPDFNVDIQQKDDTTWMMDFLKKETNLDELIKIKNELGQNFKVHLGVVKTTIRVRIEAPVNDFMMFLEQKAKPSAATRTMFDNQPAGQIKP